ncbi:MAG: hypothetical protein KAS32_06505 [Candidatus Peribacteraceae bacterium]|nr:hypothetical protein [Candidatus Peribacteraceae bacterium]
MQHTELYQNEAVLSDEDHIKLKRIGKCLFSSFVTVAISLIGIVVYS